MKTKISLSHSEGFKKSKKNYISLSNPKLLKNSKVPEYPKFVATIKPVLIEENLPIKYILLESVLKIRL